jgi:hypothetical protein
MGGMKVLYALMLLAMIGMVQAECIPGGCGKCTISCPSSYCSGNSRCTYPAASSYDQPCSGGICLACPPPPPCNANCSSCGTGLTCNNGECIQICGGQNNHCPLEAAPSIPASDTLWIAVVAVIALVGLGIGYFIMKDVLTVSAPSKKSKKKRR